MRALRVVRAHRRRWILAGLAGLLLGGCDGSGNQDASISRGQFGPGSWENGVPLDRDGDGQPDVGIGSGLDPDLAISAAIAPHLVLSGSAFLLQLTIANGGPGIAPGRLPWIVYKQVGDQRVQVQAGNLDRLDPGAAATLAVDVPTEGQPLGELVLCFVIDPTDLVRETDERNNEHELTVQVVLPINN